MSYTYRCKNGLQKGCYRCLFHSVITSPYNEDSFGRGLFSTPEGRSFACEGN